METSFANGGQISAGHAEPWAKPAVLPKILQLARARGRAAAASARALDWAQWRWGLGFLRECIPGRFERNSRALAGLAGYSRDCLRALREQHRHPLRRAARAASCSSRPREADLEALAQPGRSDARIRRRGASSRSRPSALRSSRRCRTRRSRCSAVSTIRTTSRATRSNSPLRSRERARARGVRFHVGTVRGDRRRPATASKRYASVNEHAQADAYVVALGSYSPLLLTAASVSASRYIRSRATPSPCRSDRTEPAPTVEPHRRGARRSSSRGSATACARRAPPSSTGYDTSINAARCDAILRAHPDAVPGACFDRERSRPGPGCGRRRRTTCR